MKKIILAFMLMFMSISTLSANSGYAFRHANPLPNLMRVAMGNADLLDLNKEQRKSLMAYAKSNRPKARALVKKILEQEKALMQEALTTDKGVDTMADKMLESRKNLIEMKSACRTFLKSVLTEKQYKQVISIYKSTK